MDIPSNNKQLLRSGSSCNKIRQIVRLQQLLKKWKKIAAASPSSTHLQRNTSSGTSINKFLKKTLSFSDKEDVNNSNSNNNNNVPKGCLAVLCVGKEEEKRFVIPMDYLAHQSFQVLLREAEEEFGFQQQGILKIPCQISLFDKILKTIQSNKQQPNDDTTIHNNVVGACCCSPDNHQQQHNIMPPQLCSI
ncbi:hypothetical protein EJD97_001836 [Solanum chilense]|uniref:Auxin-responsive protein n=1 Tax=Solanum chilense TaxID=4083 RepID=A0A6N2C4A8_SOLCI|nr:hypothetical protein EJD97_001836 [Solanum chilense]